ncbi:hypothetical protein JOF56_005195 [Kibdelosporangium banguiense]|uniref:DUF4407 domain-containing protein n=1 Tax=Kibdelosporangium banguiense TaxID=1365924 RepID=A0ABS4TK74_9PSEU|nr:DUF4407 domain-containing protein [Kibdelosporangium banguiense]MBP2324810.1 hypothetical protein [Kibdelosporangium banguiense]
MFAFAEAALALPPICFGVHLSPAFVPVALVATVLVFWFVNMRTAAAVDKNAPLVVLPRARRWFALGVALVITYAAMSWAFDTKIEEALQPAAIPGRITEIDNLQKEKEALRGIAEQPVPTPDKDADVGGIQQRIDVATKEFGDAKREELCELDGTCGTRVPGQGKAYFEKVAYSLQVKGRMDALSADLASAKKAAESRFAQRVQDKSRAVDRMADIDRRLREFPASSGEKRSWLGALWTVGEQQAFWMILISVGTLGLSVAIDLSGFRLIARRVYRRTRNRTEFADEAAEQIDTDHWHPDARPVADFLRGRDER